MLNGILEFEKPLLELERKIQELRSFSKDKGIDLSEEITTLENKAKLMKKEIYAQLSPWEKVQLARHPQRPSSLDYIKLIFEDFIELHGDRLFGDDKSIIGGLARLDGRPITFLGYQKGKDTKENIIRNFGMPHPEGYRKALRLMKQAEKFNRPIVCLIDTPGAYPGIAAEERGQGEAIARNLLEMSLLRVPIVAVVIGEGGSGGALALGVGDKIAMLEHSIYSVSSPEACAAILWKDSTKAQEAARVLKLTAEDLNRLDVIDEIVPEPLGGAHKDPTQMASLLKGFLRESINSLVGINRDDLLAERYNKLKRIGKFSHRVEED